MRYSQHHRAASRSSHRRDSGSAALSHRDVEQLYGSMKDARDHIAGMKSGSKLGGKAGELIEALEIGGGALATGLAAGYLGTANIPGTSIPAGLVAGAAGHALAIFGNLSDEVAEHVVALSNGAIAGYLALWGLGQGQQMAEAAGQPTGTVGINGAPPTIGCGPTGCGPTARAAMGPGGNTIGNANVRPWTEAEIAALYARRAA